MVIYVVRTFKDIITALYTAQKHRECLIWLSFFAHILARVPVVYLTYRNVDDHANWCIEK